MRPVLGRRVLQDLVVHGQAFEVDDSEVVVASLPELVLLEGHCGFFNAEWDGLRARAGADGAGRFYDSTLRRCSAVLQSAS